MAFVARLLPSVCRTVPAINAQAVRSASKKSGGNTQSGSNGRGHAKHYGWKVSDGQLVTSGSILVKQRRLRYHPGENVRLSGCGDLTAIEHGTAVITCEAFAPDPERGHAWVKRAYGERPAGRTIYKKYYHVLTRPQVGRFRLVDEV